MKISIFRSVQCVFLKEIICGMRFKAVWAVMLMFSLTTLSCVSLAIRGMGMEPSLLAALLWIILFFSAMAGIDRVFETEYASGTILSLRIYGSAQAVLFGKLLYVFCLLLLLAVFIVPLYFVFMDVLPQAGVVFFLTLLLGLWGIASLGTIIAAISGASSVHGGLFHILMLPLVLPVFLLAISLTTMAFGDGEPQSSYLLAMLAYDAAVTAGASVLFDYIWYEG